MRTLSRFLSISIIALLLGTQWFAQAHRVEHRPGIAPTGAMASPLLEDSHASAGKWGHDASTVECALYDALTCGAALNAGAFPSFFEVAFPSLFLFFLSAQVALRARRATARGPPHFELSLFT